MELLRHGLVLVRVEVVYGVCHNIDVRQEKSLKKLAVDENCFTPQKNLNHFNN